MIMNDSQRILVVSHGHPDHSKGGAELAAYNLFKQYQKMGIETMFLARSGEASHGGSVFSSRKDDSELFFHTGVSDWFIISSANTTHLTRDFAGLLSKFKPTVIHFHHYVHMGIEIILTARRVLPSVRILLTLHEYIPICFNDGQMVKRGSDKLCYESSYVDCAQCFPEKSSSDFFLRKQYFLRVFDEVDQFISPSYFLLDRYVKWGIPANKIVMVENGQPLVEDKAPRHLQKNEKRGRFAFFGQINQFKGIEVLLRAFSVLSETTKEIVHLDIHGANLEVQSQDFQDRIHRLLDDLGDSVTLHGSYESHEMPRLLYQCDWMIIPSIWWENSPMVIQEAFNHGRPIIASDIGGMAEKIEDGVTGLHFRRNNAQSLAQTIERAMSEEVDWNTLHNSIVSPLSIEECAEMHLGLV
ncbi:glycosyltransferase family 4 protein [Psychrobacter sp. BI730]|uniref:glycosyltransferase family 4 protein n=1 Tax=Psychrobacter sp. BI730 TaxID=2705463 RepID=UPI001C535119|nr:glycosyltransferase family 4 protein [Psychrobacter sp. BI730]